MRAHLDVTCPAVQVHVQVLDGAKLAEQILQVLLGRLLVYVGDDDDPALDGAHSCRAGLGARIASLGIRGRGVALLGLVNVHFGVGHIEGHGLRVCVGAVGVTVFGGEILVAMRVGCDILRVRRCASQKLR